MDFLAIHQIAGIGTGLPIGILMLENDEDRDFVMRLYTEYKATIYHTAREYFDQGDVDIDDAISATVEKICRYCSSICQVPEKRRKAYLIAMTSNVCRDMLRKRQQRNNIFDFSIDQKNLEAIPSEENLERTVFDQVTAREMLCAFDKLSVKERMLIQMHHIDRVSTKDMAKELGNTEGAIRTALNRARKHLLTIIREDKGDEADEQGL